MQREASPKPSRGRPKKPAPFPEPSLAPPPHYTKAERAEIAKQAREDLKAKREQEKQAAAQKAADQKAKQARLKELERELEQQRRELAGAPPPKSHKKKPPT